MSQQNSATPWDFIRALEHKFKVKITFDLACTTFDKKAEDGYFFDLGVDATKQDWSQIPVPKQPDGKESAGFLNPPWKKIEGWAKLCCKGTDKVVQSEREEGPYPGDDYDVLPGLRIFSLFPAGVGTNWFRRSVHGQADVYFLSPRLVYTDPRTGKPFAKRYGKKHPKAGEIILDHDGNPLPQTGLNDAILCDWAGSGDTFCWNWKEELDRMQKQGHNS